MLTQTAMTFDMQLSKSYHKKLYLIENEWMAGIECSRGSCNIVISHCLCQMQYQTSTFTILKTVFDIKQLGFQVQLKKKKMKIIEKTYFMCNETLLYDFSI